jgi:hypothetical protein
MTTADHDDAFDQLSKSLAEISPQMCDILNRAIEHDCAIRSPQGLNFATGSKEFYPNNSQEPPWSSFDSNS